MTNATANESGAGVGQQEGSEVEQLMKQAEAEVRQDEELARRGVDADRLLDERFARLIQGLNEGQVSESGTVSSPTTNNTKPSKVISSSQPADNSAGSKGKDMCFCLKPYI